MLHELLFALYGYEGKFFSYTNGQFEVTSGVTYFHPSECGLLLTILQFGAKYKKIKSFCSQRENGLYLSALQEAVLRACDPYKNAVINLEEVLLNNPHLPLSYLLVSLQPLEPTLTTLGDLIAHVQENKIYGCKILETVHNMSLLAAGVPQSVLQRIEQQVHVVLYEQLMHWLLHGVLLDPHKELFIKVEETAKQNEETRIALLSELLPSHIPLRVAEKIIFVGESICVFHKQSQMQDYRVIEMDGSLQSNDVLLRDKEKDFEMLLKQLLDSPELNLDFFSDVIERIYNCVSERLWTIVMDANFLEELSDLKSFYLLGRGELFQAFIGLATPILNLPIDPASNLNGLLQRAGQQLLIDDGVLEKFSLTLKASETAAPMEERGSKWNNLSLCYKVKWPLVELLGISVQEKYHRIFDFLLSMKRVQYRLQHLWILQMQCKDLGATPMERLKWTLRHHMSLLIDNIQYYLHVDVLESHYWKLIQKLKEDHDYQQMCLAHEHYLSDIAAQCFLNNNLISGTLLLIIEKAHQFCDIVETSLERKKVPKLTANSSETLKKVSEEFDRASAKFFLVLSTLRQRESSHHMMQLIMRIDYNKYFSRRTASRRIASNMDLD